MLCGRPSGRKTPAVEVALRSENCFQLYHGLIAASSYSGRHFVRLRIWIQFFPRKVARRPIKDSSLKSVFPIFRGVIGCF
jgi:hypothetical protein